MITVHDLYTVMTAMVPLYVAMILAYGSVRWWNIFSPDQCSGINRFVAIFAVPLLSFHFISLNNPYEMNFRFIAADTLQKIIVLVVVGVWAGVAKNGSLDWLITLFSVSTLPNTLVMGIPLLIAMYGDYSGQLMVQVVVMQCIIWYTILLFLFEYRGAKILIKDQFPETAGSIASFKVEYDVVSLDGHDFLETEAEIGDDGKLHVTVRKSNASRSSLRLTGLTPRPSNLTGMEIYSLSSSRNQTPRESSFNHSDFYSMMGSGHTRTRPSSFDESTVPEFRSNSAPNPENITFGFESYPNPNPETTISGFRPYPTPNPKFITSRFGSYPDLNPEVTSTITKTMTSVQQNELQMFIWSSSGSPVSESGGIHVYGGDFESVTERSSQSGIRTDSGLTGDAKLRQEGLGFCSGGGGGEEREKEMKLDAGKQMPPVSVMSRLILIMVWRKLIRNPNTYSSLIGLIWSLVSFRWHVPMPKIVEKSISILSDAGLGMAMFSLGLFMALQPKLIACGNSVAVFSMAVRFLTGPAVMATASIIVGLRGTLLRVAIVQAALPQGIVPFVFAKEYNVHPTILSTGVVFGMLIALPITLVYYILLGL